jgi:hypothetical protein
MKTRRPSLGRRIARGLSVLVEVAEDAKAFDAPRLFALGDRDRQDLDRAREYVRALARWCRSRSSAPPPSIPERDAVTNVEAEIVQVALRIADRRDRECCRCAAYETCRTCVAESRDVEVLSQLRRSLPVHYRPQVAA